MIKQMAKLATIFIRDKEERRKRRNELIEQSFNKTKLIMVLLCKDEADILDDWFLFHKAMGVDAFIVTDNGSVDGSREIVQKYKDKGWVLDIIDEPSTTIHQADWCNRMILLAKNKYGADWIISSDADEFWYSNSLNLKHDIMENSDCNLLSVYLKNFIPYLNSDKFINDPYFIARRLHPFEEEKYNLKSKMYSYEDLTPKVIMKAANYKMIGEGNHKARMYYKRKSHISDIVVYHYYIRNFKHFNDKVRKGGEAIKNLSNKSFGTHWRDWYENYYLKNNMQTAWNEMFLFEHFDDLCNIGVIVKDTSVADFMEKIRKNEG